MGKINLIKITYKKEVIFRITLEMTGIPLFPIMKGVIHNETK